MAFLYPYSENLEIRLSTIKKKIRTRPDSPYDSDIQSKVQYLHSSSTLKKQNELDGEEEEKYDRIGRSNNEAENVQSYQDVMIFYLVAS